MIANKDEIQDVLPKGFLGLLESLSESDIPAPESEDEQLRFAQEIQSKAEEMAMYYQGLYARAILIVREEHACDAEDSPNQCGVMSYTRNDHQASRATGGYR